MFVSSLLVVDDEPQVTSSLKRLFRKEGYKILTANSAKAGIEILEDQEVGVILSDYMMPEMDGIAFLAKARQQQPEAVRIMLTAYCNLRNAMAAINRIHIFAYHTKPWEPEELRSTIANGFEYYNLVMENRRLQKKTADQNRQLMDMNENLETLVGQRTLQLEEMIREGVIMLAVAAEAKDDDTGGHIQRIQDMSLNICKNLGLSDDDTEKISFFSMMHDIGKIHIPDSILKKRGPLNKKEWEIMKTHSATGKSILGKKPFYRIAREIARSHHEKWDGSGYPDGMKGEQIPLSARIVTVADIFDALTHERPYKPAWPIEKALSELKDLSEKTLDPDVFRAFAKMYSDY